jgi:hypothetical protein
MAHQRPRRERASSYSRRRRLVKEEVKRKEIAEGSNTVQFLLNLLKPGTFLTRRRSK